MAVLTLRGYARHRGVTLKAVQKAIASGRITTLPDGRIDSDQADGEWDANTNPALQPVREAQSSSIGLDYFKARAIRENYLARLAKIEFEEKSGKLINRDEVHVAAFTKARTVRDNLLNIPDRVAAAIAAESDESRVHKILTEELRRALDELSGSNGN